MGWIWINFKNWNLWINWRLWVWWCWLIKPERHSKRLRPPADEELTIIETSAVRRNKFIAKNFRASLWSNWSFGYFQGESFLELQSWLIIWIRDFGKTFDGSDNDSFLFISRWQDVRLFYCISEPNQIELLSHFHRLLATTHILRQVHQLWLSRVCTLHLCVISKAVSVVRRVLIGTWCTRAHV